MKNLAELMNQAKNLEGKLRDMQTEIDQLEMPGEAGAGLVKAVISGRYAVKSLYIDPSLMKESEREILEDLIIAALNDARAKLEAHLAKKMEGVTGGFGGLGGLGLPG
ncbi:MAG: YbaB/EbfC family nucleoid-associated protein [Parvibaculaceae bacterium]|nr:YbaB/EbfC family nucleoid-associated protein [Parvibaculaceae bacterium]